jgi:hypothetical protein
MRIFRAHLSLYGVGDQGLDKGYIICGEHSNDHGWAGIVPVELRRAITGTVTITTGRNVRWILNYLRNFECLKKRFVIL